VPARDTTASGFSIYFSVEMLRGQAANAIAANSRVDGFAGYWQA
jgi:hypothetical protein